ncbi:MAG: hypothetical protein ACREL7_18650 [Longimicrobiales bacterium]
MPDQARPLRRRLNFFLRDFRLVEAWASPPDGVTLCAYLARRKTYIPILDARWTPSGETVAFAAVKRSQLLYAVSPDGDVAHAPRGAVGSTHGVEMLLEGGLFVRGSLPVSDGQRLADYLDTAGPFLPLSNALLRKSGRPPRQTNVVWGDIALNQDVIQAIWEVAVSEAEAEGPARVARPVRRDRDRSGGSA